MVDVKEIRLIVCDIDQTILPYHQTAISRRLKGDFDLAEKKGISVFIDTGRHYTLLPESLFADLPMERIGTVNGAIVNDRNGTILFQKPMPLKVMCAMIDFAEKHGIGLGFKFTDAVVTYANDERFLDGYCKDEKTRRKVIQSQNRDHHLTAGAPVGAFMIGTPEEIEPYKQELEGVTFAFSTKRGYDVFLNTVDKTTAAEYYLKENHLTWDNVIAFGDAGNDTPLIKKAGIGVALGNGKDDIKEYADIIADTCENDGVAKILEELQII